MIKDQTILILGAGASVPYGFPTGNEMIQIVLTKLISGKNSWIPQLCEYFKIDEGHIEKFKASLKQSDQPSVDAFLERRPEFLEVGKLTMALAILTSEKPDSLLNKITENDNWYKYLFLKMDSPRFSDWAKNNIAIITFNYDRSLEEYLFQRLKHSHGMSDSDCATQLSMIKIVHVHGSLGPLPWQASDGKAYTPSYSIEDLKKASSNILVISDPQKTSNEFERAYDLILKAKQIFFLGFGYYKVNLNRLRINDLPKDIYKDGTSVGLYQSDVITIRQEWGIDLRYQSGNCLEYLRNEATLK